MDILKKFFDDFTFYGRVMPVLVLASPLILASVVRGLALNDWLESGILLIPVIALLTFSSKVARDRGKHYEDKMYKRLGAKPTTIILRFSDSFLDEVTKQRYHKKLNAMGEFDLPEKVADETMDDDIKYESAATLLRNYANANRDKEPRLYQELKDYNFYRNLYGGKMPAMIVYSLVAVREVFLRHNFSTEKIVTGLFSDYAVLLIMLISIFALLLFVRQKNVEQKAFDYAKTLVEVCERI